MEQVLGDAQMGQGRATRYCWHLDTGGQLAGPYYAGSNRLLGGLGGIVNACGLPPNPSLGLSPRVLFL